jgi:hypothetical protein
MILDMQWLACACLDFLVYGSATVDEDGWYTQTNHFIDSSSFVSTLMDPSTRNLENIPTFGW